MLGGPLLRTLFSTATKSKPYLSPNYFRHYSAASIAAAAAAPTSFLDPARLRNVAVIAHVDHGKTTLMDRLLRQCGADIPHERAMDSINLERERGITISSKVTSVTWKENELNMVDTPGHADFGGEVERVVGMVEGAILVVDAGEGPLAQTKFVLAKALKYGLRPILLLNKVDKPSVSEERCDEVESLVFDLFANLGASEEQLDFPVLYASAKEGWASLNYTKSPPNDAKNMSELLDTIVRHVPSPTASLGSSFQMLVSMMEKDTYLGRILTGRVHSGIVRVGDKVHGLRGTDEGVQKIEEGKVVKLMKKKGTSVALVESAGAGDIVCIAGLASPSIGHTVANTEVMVALPTVELDPPTISMTFGVNDSPLAGRDGVHLTGGKIGERLMAEAETNLAINVIPGLSESYEVQGRGELQLGILIENMRREGFELSVSPPKVMYKIEKGEKLEPLEEVTVEIDEEHVGTVMEALSHRRAEVCDMGPVPGHVGRTRMLLTCPSRVADSSSWDAEFRVVLSALTHFGVWWCFGWIAVVWWCLESGFGRFGGVFGAGFRLGGRLCISGAKDAYQFVDRIWCLDLVLFWGDWLAIEACFSVLLVEQGLCTGHSSGSMGGATDLGGLAVWQTSWEFEEGKLAYGKHRGALGNVRKGVLVSMGYGSITAHALMSLESRGTLFVSPGQESYDGMIIGENSRDTDMDVNPVRAKELNNIRAASKDENVKLTPPRLITLEEAIGYVASDELIEVTPKAIRLRKKYLDVNKRKTMSKKIKE
ncbi:hypothetical protein KSS87_016638 [Heliosperma pusillum]|nr:hypothetical protein KSS87_016638 [Heliosperma pusillum]